MADEQRKHRSLDKQIAAFQAEQLRQRAANLPDTGEIVRKLKDIEEAARTPRTAQEEAEEGKDLANALNALEGEIRAREAKAKKEEQKEMHGMINAAEDLTDSFRR